MCIKQSPMVTAVDPGSREDSVFLYKGDSQE